MFMVTSRQQIWFGVLSWPWWFDKADSLDLKHLVVCQVQIQHYTTSELKKLTLYVISKVLG